MYRFPVVIQSYSVPFHVYQDIEDQGKEKYFGLEIFGDNAWDHSSFRSLKNRSVLRMLLILAAICLNSYRLSRVCERPFPQFEVHRCFERSC